MASILDAGVVGIFSGIFTFLLVYAFMWGVLSWRKPFGDKNSGVYAIIALMCAMLSSIIAPIRLFIGFIAPWYLAFALVIFFILFLTGIFGLSADKEFPKIIADPRVYVWLIIISVVIAVAGLAFTFGQTALESTNTVPTAGGSNSGGLTVIGANGGYQEPGTIVAGTPVYQSGNGYPIAGQPGSTATPDFQTNLINTMIHPKVLGLFITLIVACLAIYFLSSN
jgi:hypothetical protein